MHVLCVTECNFCLGWIDALIDRVRKQGQFATEARRSEVIDTFRRARSIYEKMGQ